MLSNLDYIIFPDRCEVYEVVPSQRYVYAIYKNGSSSLQTCGKDQGWRVLLNEQIKRLQSIDIILRDPYPRMISGINIYLQQIAQQNPNLDRATTIWFVKNYLFLNRHFCPQFHWLINLARYTQTDTVFNFYSMSELDNIVDRDFKPDGFEKTPQDFETEIGPIANNEMYTRLDQALLDTCMDKSLTWTQIITNLKNKDPTAYDYTVGHAMKILEPLSVLPKN